MINNIIFQKLFLFLFNLWIIIIAFLSPISVFINTIIILILIDFITALFRAKKKKKKIESKKMRKTATKMVMYILFIISSYLLMFVTFGNDFFVTNFVFGMLALTEVVSIGENMSIATDKTIFIKMTKKISDFFTNKINNMFK